MNNYIDSNSWLRNSHNERRHSPGVQMTVRQKHGATILLYFSAVDRSKEAAQTEEKE